MYCLGSIFFNAATPPVGQGLFIIETSRSHSYTPHSVGLFWTGDQPEAKNLYSMIHKTHKRQPFPRRNSKPQSQQASGRRLTP